MYSDMSTRTNAFSSLNINSAKALVNSVLPTPVGPKNINEPIGLFGSDIPARDRRTVSATFFTASDWPMTRFSNSDSIRNSFCFSSSSMRINGIPVQRDTTSAISSAVISSFRTRRVFCIFFSFCIFASSSFFSTGISPYLISAARVRSCFNCALSASLRKDSKSFLIWRILITTSRSLVQRTSKSFVLFF